jgi:hypothetical protein
MVAEIEQARASAEQAPGVDPVLLAAEIRVRAAAADRVAELTGAPAAAEPAADPEQLTFNMLGHRGAWHPQTNPLVIDWWPDFANRWLNQRIGRAQDNLERMEGNPDLWLQAFMGALPTALFVLMPVFALLLKLFYIGTRRLYLEHLVVALYSHAFLLLSLLALFLINALKNVLVPGAVIALTLVEIALYTWMPIYLLLMQKRVYQQAWWLTLPKYLLLGTVYFALVTVGIVYATLAGVTS